MGRVEELKKLLDYYNHLYYVENTSEISDAEYDELEREYQSLTGEKYYTNFVPGGVSNSMKKVKHVYPPKSLDKINSLEDLRKEMVRLMPGVMELKYDGLTLIQQFVNSEIQVVTRGSGEEGEDVTANTKHLFENVASIQGLPIRVEALIPKSLFSKINEEREKRGEEPYENLRNAASGMVRNLKGKKADGLTYFAYDIMGCDLAQTDKLTLLENAGYNVAPREHVWEFNTLEDIDRVLEIVSNFEEFRDSLDFEIDGLVIKSNKKDSIKLFGETAHHYKNAIAYKFPSQGVWTTCADVVWTVGRTGKVVPNARIQPIRLLNSTVSKATLHNASMVERLDIRIGCQVYVVKCNDVIPGVLHVADIGKRSRVNIPTVCPVCGDTLEKVESKTNPEVYQLYCRNHRCESKTILNIVNASKKEALNITGLSIETATKMYDDGIVDYPEDIFDLTIEDIEGLDGYSTPSATKLYNQIQKAKTPTLARFITACSIPLVGKSTAELIAPVVLNYEGLMKDIDSGCPKISQIKGIGDNIVDSISRYRDCLSGFYCKGVRPIEETPVKIADNQLTFVVTGKLPEKRSYYENLIKGAGHKVASSVSNNTDYLLLGEKAGANKSEKAKECGTKIITTLEELQEILNRK